LYDLVHTLRARGMSYGRIQENISASLGSHISKGLVSEWVRGIHEPLGRVNEFNQTATLELAYVIGVVLSDGNINSRKYDREVLLSVTDREYAEEFRRCLGRVVSGFSNTKVRRSDKRNRWIVQKRSILLYQFLRRPWSDFIPFIEHDTKCTNAFLRGFYDGEGSISGRSLTLYNTQLDLLTYIRDLLSKLKIETTEIRVGTRAGTELRDPLNGRIYTRNSNCFSLRIRSKSLPQFARDIGFTIIRKQQRLVDALTSAKKPITHFGSLWVGQSESGRPASNKRARWDSNPRPLAGDFCQSPTADSDVKPHLGGCRSIQAELRARGKLGAKG
jgi:intein-encoded DNA endonuclease-like protein